MSLQARPLAGRADITAVQELASRAWPRGWHPGGLGWALARGRLANRVLLFEDRGGLAAFAGIDGHEEGELMVLVADGRSDVARAVVSGCLEEMAATVVTVEAGQSDTPLRDALESAGFALAEGAGPGVGLVRPASGERPEIAAGYRVRPVRDDELDLRVACHRAAWRPADLPYAAHATPEVDPAAESPFDRAAYDAVRDTWLYSEELDLVVEAADGALAGCAIAWYDPASRTAEIEPLGVVPAHRGRRLASAMCLEAGRRVAALGGETLFINTAVDEDYPAPGAAYLAAGFAPVERTVTYRLERGA